MNTWSQRDLGGHMTAAETSCWKSLRSSIQGDSTFLHTTGLMQGSITRAWAIHLRLPPPVPDLVLGRVLAQSTNGLELDRLR
jgi:hypothetical protein